MLALSSRRLASHLLAACSWVLGSTALPAADVAVFGVYKQQYFVQSDASAPTPHPDFPHGFRIFARAAAPGSIESTTLQFPPVNAPTPIGDGGNGIDYLTEGVFTTKGELDATAGNGLYRFTFSGGTDGTFNTGVLLNFTDAYPGTPRLLTPPPDAHDANAPLAFEWTGFEGGRVEDVVQFRLIDRVTGLAMIDTGSPVDAARLNGLTTGFTVPADVLEVGRRYTGTLTFFRVTGTSGVLGGTYGVAAFARTTVFELQTAGLTAAPSLSLVGVEGSQITLEVRSVEFVPVALQHSSDLKEWTTLFTTTPLVGTFHHRAPMSAASGPVFFRAVTNP